MARFPGKLVSLAGLMACMPAAEAAVAALPLFGNGAARLAVESCVSTDAIEFRIGDNSAILDAADRDMVHAAVLHRYPVLRSDGFAPSHIVLWKKPEADWLYVTLLANPQKPHERCFTATFAAHALAVTPILLKKYFATGAAKD